MSALRVFAVLTLVLASACAKQPLPPAQIGETVATQPDRLASPPTFVRVKKQEEHELLGRKIKRTNLPETTLLEAVWSALPFYVTVEGDSRVDLSRPVSVRADEALGVGDYLRYLSQLTGYHFELLPGTRVVRVSSHRAKTWNLATLASAGDTEISLGGGDIGGGDGDTERGAGQRGTGAEISKSISKGDPWRLVVAEANCIMGTPACGDGTAGDGQDDGSGVGASARAADGSWVSSNRLTGALRASGPPQKIAQLERWLGPLQKSASRFIRLDVAVFEVLLDHGRGRSVDFRVLNEGIDRTTRLDGLDNDDNRRARYSGGIVGNALENAGSMVLGATAKIGDLVLDFVFRFLETEGEVTLLNRANLIIPNGETATIRSVESFYYVDDQEVIPGGTTGNLDRISTSLARESVGLEIAITPQYLDERRLLVSIVPALSALQRFDNIESGGTVISEAPRTTLTTLSARGVTENGRPIALGGIRTEGVQTRLTDVGVGGVPDGGLLDSGSRIHQRRQLIVLVIPHEVEV